MRAMKKSAISFGLATIPVSLIKATESHDVTFHQYHAGCGGAVGRVAQCRVCGEALPSGDIAKGIEVEGATVFLSAEELDALRDEQEGPIEVLQFVDASEIDPIRFDASYYLEPDKSGASYGLLARVLRESRRVGIVRFALRTRTVIGVLRSVGEVLVVHTIYWADEIRDRAELRLDAGAKSVPSDKLVAAARNLIDSMTEPFDPDAFHDTYNERVQELAASRATGGEFSFEPTAQVGTADINNLLSQLERSIELRQGA